MRRLVTVSRPLEYSTLRWLDQAPARTTTLLLPRDEVPSHGPVLDDGSTQVSARLPAVLGLHLRDAKVNSWSSSVVLGSSVYMERALGPSAAACSQAAGHVVAHGPRGALIRARPRSTIPSGFFLGGNGAFNYYHWLIEILPKLEFLPRLGDTAQLPLLVPSEVGRTAAMRESLERFAPEREVVYLDSAVTYEVTDLVHVTNLHSCPFNLRPGCIYEVGDFAYRDASVQFLRLVLADQLRQGSTATHRSRRVFLARSNDRRAYNQDEILAVCKRHAFDAVRPETLSFAEQVALFAGAEVIVGPSGAAWANVVFASPGMRGLTWLPDAFRDFAVYSNLARLAGGELRAITYPGAPDSTGAVYEHEYRIDTAEFERELASLLDGD